ncbi:AraC family transcriptional regulator [Caulobacter sp. KR2-114]
MIEPPPPAPQPDRAAADDVLSAVLGAIRLSGSVQFCFMPSGAWRTDAAPSLAALGGGPGGAMPFHIVAQGACWLKIAGRTVELVAGDMVAFPFATGHQLGAGRDGRLVTPVKDLPPRPWRTIPVMRYGAGEAAEGGDVRLLCGYLEFAAAGFRPLRDALPDMLHMRTSDDDLAWLRTIVAQIVSEVDRPHAGGVSMLERLTEIAFIELLRRHVRATPKGATGWLAAMTDPVLGRSLAVIHADPRRDWTGPALAAACGLSRSALAERFETVLATSPMRYLREWRLCLASVALATTRQPIAEVAHEAGYGTEAAFSRAFSRAYDLPPAAWRARAIPGPPRPA